MGRNLLQTLGSYAERDDGNSINIFFTLDEVAGDALTDKSLTGIVIKRHGDFISITGDAYGSYVKIKDCSDKINEIRKLLTDTKDADGNEDIILSLKQEKQITVLPLDSLVEFAKHPFKRYVGDRLAEMVRSIKYSWGSIADNCPPSYKIGRQV